MQDSSGTKTEVRRASKIIIDGTNKALTAEEAMIQDALEKTPLKLNDNE